MAESQFGIRIPSQSSISGERLSVERGDVETSMRREKDKVRTILATEAVLGRHPLVRGTVLLQTVVLERGKISDVVEV